jgi:putative Holliday junction resolvase
MNQGDVPRGRLLGIDHGTKVIGLAVCDANWLFARPLQLLKRKDRETDFAHIRDLVREQQIAAIVIGLPEQPADQIVTSEGPTQAGMVRRWASRLAAAVAVPVYLWEEQFSSFEAERLIRESGQRITGRIDAGAAAVILQSFIDAHPAGTPLPEPFKK